MPRILVIDDEEAMRELYRESLKDSYEVAETGDPESALMMALDFKPDAVLLDLSMPRLSGFELCQALSTLSFTQHIPVFIVSSEDSRNKAFCESLGAAGYFRKPVDFEALKKRLDVELSSKRPERRAEMRFQVKLTLKLVGKRADGSEYEVEATTDNMSAGGFLCSCSSPLEVGSTVDVFLVRNGEHALGAARVVRDQPGDSKQLRYGFAFFKKTSLPEA